MTLGELWAALEAHDWWYSFTDDPGVWRRGYESHQALNRARRLSDAHEALGKAYADWKYNGADKPEEPSDA